MYLKSISLENFKNYSVLHQDFSPTINCFVGKNGAGKTNLLDTIYYLCMCKSFFNTIDSQVINHAQEYFKLKGIFKVLKEDHEVTCTIQTRKKKIFECDNVKYDKLVEHIGHFPIVMICPDDNSLILNGSEARRKFLDNTLVQLDKQYLSYLLTYNKILVQRNALLKSFAKNQFFDQSQLDAWDVQLIEPGNYIYTKRKELLDDIEPLFLDYYKAISGNKESVKLRYNTELSDNKMETLLKINIEKDRILARTSAGIHKDDISFDMDEYAIKRFGSQGQQKSFVIALKLSQFAILQKNINIKPILLLDDIFDKLDSKRIENLLNLIHKENPFGQIFITNTEKSAIKAIFKNEEIQLFDVKNSNVTKI